MLYFKSLIYIRGRQVLPLCKAHAERQSFLSRPLRRRFFLRYTMEKYYLIGSPVAHSKSPAMHNCAFSKLGINAVYGLIEADESELPKVVDRLRTENASGWNLTMPDKTAMCDLCDELSPAARIGRSVNTVKNENGRLTGHTTDGLGFIRALQKSGHPISGNKMTLLGTGGAASSILIGSALEGASEISVFYHRPSSAERIRELAERLSSCSRTVITFHALSDADAQKREIAESSLLVNATSVGMLKAGASGSECPLADASFLTKDIFVYDAIYNPPVTRLMQLAENAGCRTENGLSMLLYQGAEAFRIWTGQDMPVDYVAARVFQNAL